jgi:hypothetical protein
MSTILKDGVGGANLMQVNSANQAEVKLANPIELNGNINTDKVGSVRLMGELDPGTITGEAKLKAVEVTSDYRLRVGLDQTAFNEVFPGAALNSTIWTAPVTTATITVAGGFANLNAAGSVAINAVARLQTYRHFPCYKSYTTYFEKEVQFTQLPVAGNVCEWGSFISTGIATPTDGVFFRLNALGEFRAVINYAGTETQSDSLDFASLVGVNTSRAFLIYVISNKALFWIDNVLVAEVQMPPAQGSVTSSMNLPIAFRLYNLTATSTAQIMKISNVNVTLADQNTNKQWAHIITGAGGHISQGQTGGTIGTTALYTNNLASGAGAAMTNTTAALGSGLGGQFTTQPTLVVGTDGIVSSYQVLAGTAILPGKSLYITRVNISSAVTSALTGGAVLYAFSLAYGHTAVSLATTESATTKAPRRLPIGMQTFPTNAAVGTMSEVLDIDLSSPIVVQPGEFIQLVAKNLGVVTSAGTITFVVGFGGYWE